MFNHIVDLVRGSFLGAAFGFCHFTCKPETLEALLLPPTPGNEDIQQRLHLEQEKETPQSHAKDVRELVGIIGIFEGVDQEELKLVQIGQNAGGNNGGDAN